MSSESERTHGNVSALRVNPPQLAHLLAGIGVPCAAGGAARRLQSIGWQATELDAYDAEGPRSHHFK